LLDFWSENGISHRVCRSSSCFFFVAFSTHPVRHC
jgi:hypothetical protein